MPEIQLPEIDVQTLARKLKSGEAFVLLDVREDWELEQAKITDARLRTAPLSRLANEGTDALPDEARSREAEIYVLCHHGNRSSQVTVWLAAQGWTNVFNVKRGIDEYAARVDEGVGYY
jgi:rhodanese-related sulfurtransferase